MSGPSPFRRSTWINDPKLLGAPTRATKSQGKDQVSLGGRYITHLRTLANASYQLPRVWQVR